MNSKTHKLFVAYWTLMKDINKLPPLPSFPSSIWQAFQVTLVSLAFYKTIAYHLLLGLGFSFGRKLDAKSRITNFLHFCFCVFNKYLYECNSAKKNKDFEKKSGLRKDYKSVILQRTVLV